MPPTVHMQEAHREWASAHRKARRTQLIASLEGQPEQADTLLDFNDISRRLSLKHALYRGVQNVPLDKIVGSVGRYQDFTRAFLPISADMGARWRQIATLYLDPTSQGVPPIELYKVGDAYFVKDGNHRVSVARQLGNADIEAYVYEYPGPVDGLDNEADIDTILLEAERREFLERTHLDMLRPGHNIRLTAPGGYTALLGQICQYQDALQAIDGTDISYETAITAWYDMVYETTIQLIEQTDVLAEFPDRTAADLFVFIRAYQAELEEKYGRHIMLRDAAKDFEKRHRQSNTLPTRTAQAIMRWLVGRLA
ncbi:MAG: hypothetical protein JW910_11265 [Anaerolineae bacterium]|nr:hypothetical protein [Anaerolineae bacterium]